MKGHISFSETILSGILLNSENKKSATKEKNVISKKAQNLFFRILSPEYFITHSANIIMIINAEPKNVLIALAKLILYPNPPAGFCKNPSVPVRGSGF
jgi:hypothetical protein